LQQRAVRLGALHAGDAVASNVPRRTQPRRLHSPARIACLDATVGQVGTGATRSYGGVGALVTDAIRAAPHGPSPAVPKVGDWWSKPILRWAVPILQRAVARGKADDRLT